MSAETVRQSEWEIEREDTGVFPRPWTRAEYDKAAELGWFDRQRVELIDGRIYEKIGAPLLPDRDTRVRPWRWTREQYEQAAELGWFEGQHVELMDGEVYQKVTQNPPHSIAICATAEVLGTAFPTGFYVRQQMPLAGLGNTDPEPDVLVVVGTRRDHVTRHPNPEEVALLVEVSDKTLRYDRVVKGAQYAAAGIADYWLLNLSGRTLEVRRDPIPLPDTPGGFGYRSVTVYAETENVSPLAAPQAVIRVADLLPPTAENPQG